MGYCKNLDDYEGEPRATKVKNTRLCVALHNAYGIVELPRS